MQTSLYPTYEYCVRALKLRNAGFSAHTIERCTGIPHNLQDELLPSTWKPACLDGVDIDAFAREATATMSLEQLSLVQATTQLWNAQQQRMPLVQRTKPVAVDIYEAARCAQAPSVQIGQRTGLLGLDETPFFAESSVSLALRLLHFNAFTWEIGKEPLGISFLRVPTPRRANVAVCFDQHLQPAAWAETLDQRLTAEIPRAAGILLNHQFNFCPECLAARFHSVVHQLSFVAMCPIHRRPLVNACVHCGEPVGSVEAVVRRGWKAYTCTRCTLFICGPALPHKKEKNFQVNLAKVEPLLAPFVSWLQDAQPRLWPLEQLMKQNSDFISTWTGWGCTTDQFLKMANALHPFPSSTRPADAADVELLRWSVLLHESTAKPFSATDRGLGAVAIYRSTLRTIDSWLTAKYPGRVDGSAFQDFEYNNVIAGPVSAKIPGLARAYLRTMFEDGSTHAPNEVRCRTIYAAQSTSAPHRLPAKAILVGLYSIALRALELRQADGIQRSRLSWIRVAESVPTVFLPESTGHAKHLAFTEGMVMAPVADGFSAKRIYSGAFR